MDKSKMLLSLAIVLGGGAIAYFYFKNQCASSPGSYPTICGWLGTPATAAAATPATTSTPLATAATVPITTPAGAIPAQVPLTTAQIQTAIAAMKAMAASDSQNYSAWSYYFQNAPTFAGAPTGFGQTGGISPNLFGAIVTLGGGDATQLISAEQFVSYWQQAMQNAGLSGFGSEIPTWMIHRGGYA